MNPASNAWKDWCCSEEGELTLDGSRIGVRPENLEYLKNRLCRAFLSGFECGHLIASGRAIVKARIDYFCKPRSKNSMYDVEDISIVVELPFIPSIGQYLKLGPKMEYAEVGDVMLDVSPRGEGLVIGLKEPENDADLRPWSEMKSLGWKLHTPGKGDK